MPSTIVSSRQSTALVTPHHLFCSGAPLACGAETFSGSSASSESVARHRSILGAHGVRARPMYAVMP